MWSTINTKLYYYDYGTSYLGTWVQAMIDMALSSPCNFSSRTDQLFENNTFYDLVFTNNLYSICTMARIIFVCSISQPLCSWYRYIACSFFKRVKSCSKLKFTDSPNPWLKNKQLHHWMQIFILMMNCWLCSDASWLRFLD